eukprot:scaffold193335_cov27-Attheya_sp.AAC.2
MIANNPTNKRLFRTGQVLSPKLYLDVAEAFQRIKSDTLATISSSSLLAPSSRHLPLPTKAPKNQGRRDRDASATQNSSPQAVAVSPTTSPATNHPISEAGSPTTVASTSTCAASLSAVSLPAKDRTAEIANAIAPTDNSLLTSPPPNG